LKETIDSLNVDKDIMSLPYYYQVEADIYSDYGIIWEPESCYGISFRAGRLIDKTLPSLLTFIINYPLTEAFPHFLESVIPVVSEHFVQTLRKAGVTNFQLFPALLQNPETSQEWTGYYAFNAIGVSKAADMKASTYYTIMEGNDYIPPVVDFDELILSQAALNDELLFRLWQRASTLIIHQKVRDVLKAETPEGGWGITVTEISVQ
jgi:hypothetical protein